MDLSIIIPAYNEEKRISRTLHDYGSYFSTYKKKTEIIVVLNGCKDNTLTLVKQLVKKYSIIRYVDIPPAIGKGGAIIEGFKLAKGDIIGFADADGATPAQHFASLIQYINGADGFIASRWIKGAVVEPLQPLQRRIASRTFNFLVRLLFGLPFHDTQCGYKLFKKKAIHTVLPALSTTRWAFDVDLLYQLQRRHFSVKEVPAVWKDQSGSSIRVPRVSLEMLLAIIRLRLIYSPLRFIVGIYNSIAASFGIRF